MEVDLPSFEGSGSGVDAMAGMKTGRSAGRRDGRSANEMRPLSISQGVLSQADGSARIKAGGTDVLVAVYGPMECPIAKQNADQLHVQISYRRREGIGGAGADRISDRAYGSGSEAETAKSLQLLVSEVVLTVLHPRKALVLAIQVLSDNGSVSSAVVNATVMAMIDAGVCMRSVPSAACISVTNKAIIVDPVKLEELEADAVVTACFDTALTGDGFMTVHTQGDCGGEALFSAAVQTCRQLAFKTSSVLRLCLEKKAEYPFVWSSV